VSRLQTAVAQALDDTGAAQVIIDLTAVDFLGSAGLRALLDAQAGCAARKGQPLRVVVDHNRPVIRPLQLTGLDQQLCLYHDVDDALSASPGVSAGPGAGPGPGPDEPSG
jgi:anti-sigma B factor antagonist